MKELLYQYARYHSWAHRRLMECILSLTAEQQHREIDSSFNSLYKTVLHVCFAETSWWSRLNGLPPAVTGDLFNGSMDALAASLLGLDENFVKWVGSRDDASIGEQFTYRNLRGVEFTDPAARMLMQVFNHSTYHNGQLVTMLHHAGVTSIPATDFIAWSRSEDATAQVK